MKTSPRRQRILVADPFLPMHDRNSGHVRLFGLLKMLVADGHSVSYVAQTVREDDVRYASDLKDIGVDVRTATPGTLSTSDFAKVLQSTSFDAIIVCFYTLAQQLGPLVRRHAPKARYVIDTVDLHFVRESREASHRGDSALVASAAQTQRNELETYRSADTLIAITEVEKEILATKLPGKEVLVVPNVHEVVPRAGGFASRSGVLFVGNFWHTPNAEGILWFLDEVLPLVRRDLPELAVHIVGQSPPPQTMATRDPNVYVHGWVASVEPFLSSCRLSIAPLRSGAGMKGKIGEALACGLPVVTTSVGAEGMDLLSGTDALIADEPADFAAAIQKAYTDAELWASLSREGQRKVSTTIGPAAVRARLRELIEPAPSAAVRYLAIPDWEKPESIRAVVSSYCERFTGAGDGPCLTLAVIDSSITEDEALARTTAALSELGLDPEAVPEMEIVALATDQLRDSAPDTVWVECEGAAKKPEHLTSVDWGESA